MTTTKISIIIPALNEEHNINQTLATACRDENVEVIVVDGGSQDNTIAVAESWGVKVLSSSPGRAQQMNLGAEAASGDILLFLHADTRLPNGFAAMVVDALQQPNVVAGAFRLRIDAQLPSLRWVEAGVNWRSRWLQMPYGDQAIFVFRKTFYHLGGFPYLPLMEDFELIKRLRKLGKIMIIPVPVLTSGRRWLKHGVWKTTLINQFIILAYLAGLPAEQIARWYRRG